MAFRTVTFFLILLCILMSVPDSSSGNPIADVTFQDSFESNEMSLKIRGIGLLRYMVFIKAYAGAFYLPENVSSEDALSEVPKRLEVEYFHPLKGKDFGSVTRKFMARNVDAQTLKKLQGKIDLHSSFYEDVKPGDRYSLTYIPGRGTELSLNGQPKGTIEGSDFAAALFSIWLGLNPMDESFKSQLLGLK